MCESGQLTASFDEYRVDRAEQINIVTIVRVRILLLIGYLTLD